MPWKNVGQDRNVSFDTRDPRATAFQLSTRFPAGMIGNIIIVLGAKPGHTFEEGFHDKVAREVKTMRPNNTIIIYEKPQG